MLQDSARTRPVLRYPFSVCRVIERGIGSTPETEADFSRCFTHLLLNLFCLKAARDHLFTDGEVIGTAPRTGQGFGVKPVKGANEIWSPNWIGRGYEIKKSQPRELKEGEQSSRHSPRTHWRSGHQKRVACGVGRTERRIVWIEPTLVMGRAEAGTETETVFA